MFSPNAETNAVKRDYQHIEVTPYGAALGAVVTGVDLRNPTEEQMAEIKWAITDHSAIFFRGQDLTPEDQERFTTYFGEFGVDPFVEGIDEHPNVLRLLKEADESTNVVFGGTWHSDWSFQDQPPSYTILFGKDIPPYGGDTLFASLYNAYESLSPTMQGICESLNVVHSAKFGYGDHMADLYEAVLENMDVKTGGEDAYRLKTHPMVTVHPESGKKVLFITGIYSLAIEGMHLHESQLLLETLQTKIVENPLNLCRFRWEPGSMAMWDNRCVQHLPMADYQGQRREMLRTIVSGGVPTGV
jgi:taurine dioxygenase